ncbi:MAG: lipopolysaccharide biosynthesis protein [Chlorobi bacterium OLB5]|nr:MAG: lipopolysaccharide biosynthesis protein [Chlorobi bacterium OLB5]
MEESNLKINSNNSSLTILDVISIFLKNKKNIFILTGIVCVVSIILYFFVFDLIYMSTASIKSTSKSSGLLGALEGGLPDIGGLDELGVGGSKTGKELATYEEILMSRRCLEVIINKFNLMEREDYQFYEDAVKEFREEKLQIKTDKLSGIMYVSVLDKDPNSAKEMVELLLTELDKINIELSVTNAKNNREFIEKRYYQAREDLKSSEDSLKSFQLIYGVAPDLQIKAAAQTAFTLEAELKAEEVKLDVLKKMLSADQPEVKMQTEKINSLKNKILGINSSTDLNEFIRLGNSPHIVISFLRLQREVEIQTKILAFILPLYEQSKIEEKRETPTIMVLDKPFVAERKTKPKRLTMVVVITFFGFFASNVLFILRYKWVQFKINNHKLN